MQFVRTYGPQMYQAGRDREGRDRVVIRGTRWPAVVAMLQQAVDFTGGILSLGLWDVLGSLDRQLPDQ